MNPTVVERMFKEIAINTHNVYPTNADLQANRNALNSLAEVAYIYMREVGIKSHKLRTLLYKMGFDPEEVLNDVTYHYIAKWEDLWRGSSPEYYIASVTKQLHNRVLDICKEKVRRQFDSIPIQEVEYNLCDKTDIEEQILASDTIFLALEYIRYQPRFYAMSLLATKFLGIKNADLSKTIVQIGFMPTSHQILDSVTQHFHLPWDFFENSFKNDYIPEYHDCQELSVYISKASNACAVSVRKKMGCINERPRR